jgi:hypothetical protein
MYWANMSTRCDINRCKKEATFVAQSIKEKLFACHDHLAEAIDQLSGKEFYVVKVKDVV